MHVAIDINDVIMHVILDTTHYMLTEHEQLALKAIASVAQVASQHRTQME